MFYFIGDFDIANYADDSAQYCTGKSAEFVVNNLEQSSATLSLSLSLSLSLNGFTITA